jgi:hypothetical protein
MRLLKIQVVHILEALFDLGRRQSIRCVRGGQSQQEQQRGKQVPREQQPSVTDFQVNRLH